MAHYTNSASLAALIIDSQQARTITPAFYVVLLQMIYGTYARFFRTRLDKEDYCQDVLIYILKHLDVLPTDSTYGNIFAYMTNLCIIVGRNGVNAAKRHSHAGEVDFSRNNRIEQRLNFDDRRDIEKAVQAYKAGNGSYRMLAKKYDVSASAINWWITYKKSYKKAKKNWNEEHMKAAVQDYVEGRGSLNHCAGCHGVTSTTLRIRCKKLNVTKPACALPAKRKLTVAAVIDIRTSAEPTKTLAHKYGVNKESISAVRRRATWKHVA